MGKKKRESEEQVLGIGGSSSEEESDDDNDDEDEENYKNTDDDADSDDSLIEDDDIYDEHKEKELDERAWGIKKNFYFGTDTTDEKIQKKLKNKNEELARLEEETARRLQDRLAQELSHLPEDDLLPQDDDDATEKKKKIISSSVEMDLSGLSRSKKLQLLKRESPEFLPLLEDIRDKSEELRKVYCPLMAAIKDSLITDQTLKQYIITKYRILYNYVTVLSVYMMTRCEQGSAASRHPVIARLTQYRQLLQELEPCDKSFGGQTEQILEDISTGKLKKVVTEEVKSNKRKKTLGILNKNKKSKTNKEKKLSSLLDESEEEEENNLKEKDNKVEEGFDNGILDADERRGIGYKIEKNKGLMPSRKKDVRNPRVKYKKKYQTKLKRRKGQVRVV